VTLQQFQLDDGRASSAGKVTLDVQLGKKVSQDSGCGFEDLLRQRRPIDRAVGLPGQPFGDASIAKGVLTVRSLDCILKDTTTNGTLEFIINGTVESGGIVFHGG
jgi:hypothetical protein